MSGQLRPEYGVKPLPRPQDQSPISVPDTPFQRGPVDRTEWEQWVAALSSDARRGAEWWAGHRSLRRAGSCSGSAPTSLDFVFGCEAAKARLTLVDQKRKSDLQYRQGWNSYTGPIKPLSAPDVQGPQAEQNMIDKPQVSDTGAADRLNAQELKRLQGQ